MAFLPLWPMICFVKIILPTLLKTCIEQRGRMAFLPLWPICPAVVNTEVRDGTSLGASGLKRTTNVFAPSRSDESMEGNFFL